MRTSITDDEKYLAICLIASRYDTFFDVFKRIPEYVQVLEHVSYEQGRGFIEAMEFNQNLDPGRIPKLRENDEQGAARVEPYPEPWGQISPSTLRYIKVLSDLIKYFGSLEDRSIVEIGVGYGGQAKVIMDYFPIRSYTFLDLEEPLALAARYLRKYSYPGLHFHQLADLPDGTYDLCISNYAFSELRPEVQDAYVERVVSRATRGYMLCNQTGADFGLSLRGRDELVDLVEDAVPGPEIPLTHPNNYLLTWDRGTAS